MRAATAGARRRMAAMASTMVAQLLKQHTAPLHASVEARLGLLDPALTLAHLGSILQRFYGFWLGSEPTIDAWAARRPSMAIALQWQRRRRSALFAEDLAVLGMDAGALAPPVCTEPADADVLGWLYVVEGSTLGGAVIDRRLHELTAGAGLTLRSFTPYAEGPGPMWRSYGAALQAWVEDDRGRTDAVVQAAVQTFAELESWLKMSQAISGAAL